MANAVTVSCGQDDALDGFSGSSAAYANGFCSDNVLRLGSLPHLLLISSGNKLSLFFLGCCGGEGLPSREPRWVGMVGFPLHTIPLRHTVKNYFHDVA